MNTLDILLLYALPYVALAMFFIGTIYRYRITKFNYSSLSSQFLEGRGLFWGSVPFHWGLLFLFFGHLIAFAVPESVLAWNQQPIRLLVLEVFGFMCGLSVLFGISSLMFRRFTNARVRSVTSTMDVLIESLILIQVVLGLWIAFDFRWGSSWFASVLTPYLLSIFLFNPQIEAVSAMSWVIKLHIAGAYLIILLIPFSRLVHVLVVPLHYVARPYQRVIWYWNKKKIRDPASPITVNEPRNN